MWRELQCLTAQRRSHTRTHPQTLTCVVPSTALFQASSIIVRPFSAIVQPVIVASKPYDADVFDMD